MNIMKSVLLFWYHESFQSSLNLQLVPPNPWHDGICFWPILWASLDTDLRNVMLNYFHWSLIQPEFSALMETAGQSCLSCFQLSLTGVKLCWYDHDLNTLCLWGVSSYFSCAETKMCPVNWYNYSLLHNTPNQPLGGVSPLQLLDSGRGSAGLLGTNLAHIAR